MNVTKLLFKNIDILKKNETKDYKIKRHSKVGTTILSLAVAVAVGNSVSDALLSSPKVENVVPHVITVPLNTNIEMSDINSLNIIMNDNDCSNSLFQEVCDCLREDGVVFQSTSDGMNINQDNSTVITLDQQYSAGSDTLIFAPYNNTRVGHSDSLAIAMHSAFDQNGFLMGNITCSQIGYKENSNGEVDFSLPTETEKGIDENCDTSFVTISFGTQNVNPQWVAKSIENGLARQKHYLDHCDNHTDLIYRASSQDSLDTVSDYFGTDLNRLKSYNRINDSKLRDSQTVINPAVGDLAVFDRDSLFEINGVKTRAY